MSEYRTIIVQIGQEASSLNALRLQGWIVVTCAVLPNGDIHYTLCRDKQLARRIG